MAPAQWRRVEELYESALRLEPAGRDAFIAEACADDEPLRQEVESLVAAFEQAHDFLDVPALEVMAASAAGDETLAGAEALPAGFEIGPFRIVAFLGGGGMGQVYRAHDTRLDRDVALKFLSGESARDAQGRKRLLREARAASALNHPHIVTVYDVDQAEGSEYIAMEYVAGQTLADLIGPRRLPVPEALKYAIQIADALAAAHEAGFVHRDLKPGNIMVTEKGTVKVLDFGLAKLTEPRGPGEVSGAARTTEGMILGTVAYMSPEQAQGKPVDARSDIFSFGAVLYEMVTGRRAFQGESKVSTLSAILHQEPAPPGEEVPRDLQKIIARCLRKDAEHRFQHMDDVRVALEELKEQSDSGKPAPAAPAVRRPVPLGAMIAAAALLAASATWYFLRRTPGPQPPLKVVPLTSYPGNQEHPCFSPDGRQVAFSWNGEKQDNYDIYVKLVSGGPALRLTRHPAADRVPAWSPDGAQIAFVRERAVYLMSPLGGPERKLADIEPMAPALAWSPDGKFLAVAELDAESGSQALYLVSLATREKRRLTSPAGGAIVSDSDPAFSPDGRRLAFIRRHSGQFLLFVLPLGPAAGRGAPSGDPECLFAATGFIEGAAWTPDGQEIVSSSDYGGRRSLWRIRVGARPGTEPLRVPGTEDGLNPAISPGTPARLAYQRSISDWNIWSMDLSGPPSPPRPIVASTWNDLNPQFSPDGSRIAFQSSRSGSPELWVAASDGSNPIQLTSFGGPNVGDPRWSPDGLHIVFGAQPGGNRDIYVIGADGGAARRLTSEPSVDGRGSWSHDGRWIYFHSNRTGTEQIWKIPWAPSGEAGAASQLTRGGGVEPLGSPDGRLVYYVKSRVAGGLWSVPATGGEEVPVLEPVWQGHWAVVDKGILFVDSVARPSSDSPAPVKFFSFETRRVSQVAAIEKAGGTGRSMFSATRDGRRIIWGRLDRSQSDLMLVENFR